MTDLYDFQGFYNDGGSKGPIYVLDSDNNVDEYVTTENATGSWLLTATLYVEGGGKIR